MVTNLHFSLFQKRERSSSSSSLNSSIIMTARKMRRILSSSDDNSSTYSGEIEQQHLPPVVLNPTRLFIPNGWIEIGLLPSSDGYGNANVLLVANMIYGDEWISLNDKQLAELFIKIRNIGPYFGSTYGRRGFYDTYDDPLIQIDVQKFEAFLRIEFTEEGEHQVINQFMIDDVTALLKMEKIIQCKMYAINFTMRDVIAIIEETAYNVENAEEIKQLCEYSNCNDTVLQLAVNHYHFFTNFVDELNVNESNLD